MSPFSTILKCTFLVLALVGAIHAADATSTPKEDDEIPPATAEEIEELLAGWRAKQQAAKDRHQRELDEGLIPLTGQIEQGLYPHNPTLHQRLEEIAIHGGLVQGTRAGKRFKLTLSKAEDATFTFSVKLSMLQTTIDGSAGWYPYHLHFQSQSNNPDTILMQAVEMVRILAKTEFPVLNPANEP